MMLLKKVVGVEVVEAREVEMKTMLDHRLMMEGQLLLEAKNAKNRRRLIGCMA